MGATLQFLLDQQGTELLDAIMVAALSLQDIFKVIALLLLYIIMTVEDITLVVPLATMVVATTVVLMVRTDLLPVVVVGLLVLKMAATVRQATGPTH